MNTGNITIQKKNDGGDSRQLELISDVTSERKICVSGCSEKAAGFPGLSMDDPMANIARDWPLELKRNKSRNTKAGHYLDVGRNVVSMSEAGDEWIYKTCDDMEHRFIIQLEGESKANRWVREPCCHKEWCSRCGKVGSPAHNERFVRWLSKIQHFEVMSYLVFTIPENIRCRYRTKSSLTELGRAVQSMLKRHGYRRGLRRWHWMGDKTPKWNPHLNVLVDGGYIPAGKLEKIKADYAAVLGVDVVSVNHSYKRGAENMIKCLRYVTRATFLDAEWDIDMAYELRGFRNMVVWGKYEWREMAWEIPWKMRLEEDNPETGEKIDIDIDVIEKLLNKVDPETGERLEYGKALPAKLMKYVDKRYIGVGFWRIIDRAPPDQLDTAIRRRLAHKRLVHFARCLGGEIIDGN